MQVELWKKYIAVEKSNPLKSEDTALVTRRVMFATEQCLLVMYHHPAVWHQAAQYLDQSSKLLTEKGVRIKIEIRLRQSHFEYHTTTFHNDIIATDIDLQTNFNANKDQQICSECCDLLMISRIFYFGNFAKKFNLHCVPLFHAI